jgi:L-fucose isomerase-like protein
MPFLVVFKASASGQIISQWDFKEAMLNTSFDWNDKRSPIVFATENDSLNGVCMLFGHLLTNTAQIFADVRTLLEPFLREKSDRL